MRLSDLHPQFLGSGGEGIRRPSVRPCQPCGGSGCDACHRTGKEYEPAPRREGVGVLFDCPCGCGSPCFIHFDRPLDGGPSVSTHAWTRVAGDTFDTLVLQPSILRSTQRGGCGWHGYIGGPGGDKPGEVVTV